MKRTYIILTICGLILSACSDFLKEESRTEIEKQDFMNTASEAETVLLGSYRSLIEEGTYALNLSIIFPLGTDIAQVEGHTTENWRIVPTNAFSATQSEIQESWKALYEGIYRTNDFLEKCAAKIEGWVPEEKNLGIIYMAEARALRALFYFELVRRWGNIPLITETSQSLLHPSQFTQAAPEDVYAFIEKDLRYAVENLPYATSDTFRKDNSYRFSRGAAMGLLTKVYATWAGYPLLDSSKWEAAATIAQELIQSNKHDLLPDYETLWENTCNGIWDPTESLIEVSFYSPTTGSGNADPCGRIGKWNGVTTTSIAGERGRCAANVKVVYTFSRDWKGPEHANDKRQELSIANYLHDEKGNFRTRVKNENDVNKQKEMQNYNPAKWDIVKYVKDANNVINDDKSNVNWYVLRYSDVLLLYAEALNEWKGGPTTDAYAALNKVRSRGYAGQSGYEISGLDQKGFREAIRQERAFELAFEGHRKLDLIRWGIYYETIRKTDRKLDEWWVPYYDSKTKEIVNYRYTVAKHTVKGKHELLPIPQRELDLCTQFKQNPNW